MSLRGTWRIISRLGPPLCPGGRGYVLALAGVAVLLLSACEPGAYQVEIFPEQHYQQSYKRQEPPRLTPPNGAVPVTGRELALSFDQANAMKNPCREGCTPANLPTAPVSLNSTTDAVAHGAEVFRVNCSMCHGPQGKGDGKVGDKLATNGYAHPPNLTAPATQGRSDGSMFWVITNGVVVMPKFGLLLTEQDRWSVVTYLRYLAQQNTAGAAPKS